MINTKKLWKQINIDYDETQPIIVEDINAYIDQDCWEFILHSENLITSDYYNQIYFALKNTFKKEVSKIKVKIKIKNNKLNQQTPSTIINYFNFFATMNEKVDITLKISHLSIEQDVITFNTNNAFDEIGIKKNINIFKNILEGIGICDYKFEFKVSETQKAQIEKRIEKKIEEHIEKQKSTVKEFKVSYGEPVMSRKRFTDISDIHDESNMINTATIEGEVFFSELRKLKETHLLTMMIHNKTGNVICKSFEGRYGKPPMLEQMGKIKEGSTVRITGNVQYDTYAKTNVIMVNGLSVVENSLPVSSRKDLEKDKRVELHVHTKMSKSNGISKLEDYAKIANHFGHKAIAITDHDVAQAFVEGDSIKKKYDLDIIYGVETSVITKPTLVFNPKDIKLKEASYVIFDLETTGLSANFNKIIEIGAVKYENGNIVDEYQKFIKIEDEVSEFTTSLTGITNSDLSMGGEIKAVLREFYEWSKDSILVAHNANFDRQFLARNYEKHLNLQLLQPVIDTLELSRFLIPDATLYGLKNVAKKYGVVLDTKSHHRADYDAQKLSEIFINMIEDMDKRGIININELNDLNNINKSFPKHNLLYVRNQEGLEHLYKLISDANTKNILRMGKNTTPRMLENDILDKREHFIYVASGCTKSMLIDSYLNHSKDEFIKMISKFDYIEILSVSQYVSLINNDTFTSIEEIKKMIKNIISAADSLNIKVIANGNVHYVEPELSVIKEVLYGSDLKASKEKTIINPETGEEQTIKTDIVRFNKWTMENKIKNENQYFKTTSEMLEEFSFLENAKEYVVENTNLLYSETTDIQIIPKDLYTPEIPGVDKKMTDMVFAKARSIYGDNLPKVVEERINKEVGAITKYGFSVIYYISHKLVKYSLDNGFLVGSRGSIGSSIVATFMDITEINPLSPHYVCPNCKESTFITDGSYGSGFDLPIKNCEKCAIELIRDGQDIPFETFLGFEGDKVPDIDLNFSGVFQAKAHEFVRSQKALNDDELFDYAHAFRAGTIGTIANKTAYAFVNNYYQLKNEKPNQADINYYLKYCEGIKRTTGQHPGGIIVVPHHRSINEFTPIQYPADKEGSWETTHFDFHSIHDNLLKLDILGHDDPTMLNKLQDLTGIDPQKVDITDVNVMELFNSTDSLKFVVDCDIELGTLGVPEFGTSFVQGMLLDTRPSTFAELVQISGLSHGTDVWLGNAKELIDNKICSLKEVIGCRDDIMVYLMYQGIESLKAFNIMENVRKGKGLTVEEMSLLRSKGIPEWYIESCLKIKYMFPKAHAAAYVLMALRVAWFKVYYPLEYYAAYFTNRISDFDIGTMIKGKEAIEIKLDILNSETEMSENKRRGLINSLLVSLEMVSRGFKFETFDLGKSQSFEFILNEDKTGLISPFISIEGLGEVEAITIVEQRNISEFATKEEFKTRTKVKKNTMDKLEFFGVFDDIADENQISLF